MSTQQKLNIFTFVLLLSAFLFRPAMAFTEESGNLISNSGFEEGGNCWYFEGSCEITNAVFHQGTKSAKITGTGLGYQGVLYNPPGTNGFKLDPRLKCSLKFWLKLEKEGESFKVRIRQFKGKEYINGKEYCFQPENTKDWKEYSYEFITDKDSDNIRLDFYFIYGKGTAYLDDVAVRKIGLIEAKSSEELTEKLKKELTEKGWALKEEENYIIAEKDGLRTYYRNLKGKKYTKPEEWEAEALVGSEVDKTNYHMEYFPVGVSFYGYQIYERAEELGLDKWEYISKVLDDLKAHHMNTIYFGNTGFDVGVIDRMINLAEEKGLKLMLQMSGAYYRCDEKEYKDNPDKRRQNFVEVNIPFVCDVMPKYKNRKGVFAWSVKEEIRKEYAKELAIYYKLVKALDPTHPILIYHNNLEAANNMEAPYPSIMGFDRYFYRYDLGPGPGGCNLRSPLLALSLFEEEVPPFYQASLKYQIPFLFCIQGVASAMVITNMTEYNLTITKENEAQGWSYNSKSNTWSGWLRYYPPKNCMKVQVWAAVASGAKGIFCYNYGEPVWGKIKVWPPKNPGTEYTLSYDPTGYPPPQWEEFGEAAKEILYFAHLILSINKRVFNLADSENPNILIGTFQEEDSNRKYLIAVNKRTGTGTWDSHKNLTPEDELTINDRGQLAGHKPAEPLKFVLKVKSAKDLYDLKEQKRVNSSSSSGNEKSYEITLPPGEGNIFLSGDEKDFSECKTRYFKR